MSKILYSALVTPDGTKLVSRSRHDYVSHVDANKKTYFLDGGKSYVRCGTSTDQTLITITTDDPWETARNYIEWGTYGPNGDQPHRYVTLAEMDTDHITKVLELLTEQQPEHSYIPYYEQELSHRQKSNPT